MKFTEEDVLRVVDACFHAFASSYRTKAKEKAQEIIEIYKAKEK